MKYARKISIISVTAVACLTGSGLTKAFAQQAPAPSLPVSTGANTGTGTSASPGTITIPAGTIPAGTVPTAPQPATSPGTPGPPGMPTGPAPTAAASPPPSTIQRESISWGTQLLRDAMRTSVLLMERNVRRGPSEKSKRKSRLSSEQVTALRKRIAAHESDHNSRIKLAQHFEATDDPDKAIEILQPKGDSLPRKGLLLLTQLYRARKNHLSEVRIFEIMLSQNERDYVVQYRLGEAYASLGKQGDAIDRFRGAQKTNAKFFPPYEAILREHKRDGRYHDAIQTVQDMIEVFGHKPDFYSELCLLYAHEAFLEKAAEVCKTAIKGKPKEATNHVFLGVNARNRDGLAASERILKKAARQFPTSELAQYAAGELSWEHKNYPAALKYFKNAVALNGKSARAQIGLARAAFHEQDYPVALEAFTKACRLTRSTVFEFRKATSTLRQRDETRWTNRFESGLSKCGPN